MGFSLSAVSLVRSYRLDWVRCVLDTPDAVIRALLTYTDWWQPITTSVMQVGALRRSSEDPRRDLDQGSSRRSTSGPSSADA